MTLETKRLSIRRLCADDWREMKDIFIDFNHSPYAVYDRPMPTEEEDARALTKRFAESGLFFAVRLKESTDFLGYVCFHQEGGCYDLGYCFHSAYHRKGYAYESTRALLDHVVSEYGAAGFTAGTAMDNLPSRRLLEKLGFVCTATETVSFAPGFSFRGGRFELKKKRTKEQVQQDLDTLPVHYKTADVDRLIRRYVKEKADVSALRPHILAEQQFHRIYFYVSLEQIRDVKARMAFIHENLLFSDWWHTDQIISYVADLEFETALDYARGYIRSADPFIRRWGYVLFISKLCRGHAAELLPLMAGDDHYYVQMAQAWLIAELAVFEPEAVHRWMGENDLRYNINGKAIQKICDSFRIPAEWKERFKQLRPALRKRK